jgi:hypothetical protein
MRLRTSCLLTIPGCLDFLNVQAFSYFEHLRRRLEAEESEPPENQLIELELSNIGLDGWRM